MQQPLAHHLPAQGLLSRLSAFFATRHEARRNRAEFNKLLDVDDHLLKDMGVRRDEVRWAAQLKRSQDPGLALRQYLACARKS